MATTIKLKNSVTTTNAPSSLVQGEVAINITDKKVWVGNAATTPIQLLGDGGSVNFTTVDTTNLQVTNIKAKDGTASASIANSTGALTVAAAFAANGGTTLGDASGDALTINSSAVSIPNGLNFDSNTLVIDATNNRVGVGVASPSYQLHASNYIGLGTQASAGSGAGINLIPSSTLTNWFVGANYNISGAFEITPSTAGGGSTFSTPSFLINSSGYVGIGMTPVNIFNVKPHANGYFRINQGTTTAIQMQSINAAGTAFYPFLMGGSYTVLETGGTERMRIDSSGDLLVGTTSTGGKITVLQATNGNYAGAFQHSNTSPYGVQVYYSNATPPNNTTNRFIDCEDTGGFRFQVRSNGGIANYSANDVNLSDAREKTNIELAGSYLNKICSIPVKTFNYIDQNLEEDAGLTLGVIAQDVQAVAPELVMESDWSNEKDGSKMRLSIYQTDLQYALMKCIQELKAELDATKAEVALLKSK